MVSETAAKTAETYFGRKVVGAAFLVATFGFGVGFYGPPVFLRTLHAERGWAISTISAAITVHFLFGALLVAYLPEAHRRWGIVRVTQAGAGLAAIGILAWASAAEAWQLFPIALVSGAGWAATSGAAINAIVAPWFDKDRPRALSLAFNGASIGGMVFTPLWVMLIGELGFVTTAALIGIAITTTLWPIAAHYLQPPPGGAAAARPASTLTKGRLLRDRRFVTISAAFALGLFAQAGLFAHLLTRLTPEFGTNAAAWAIGLVTVCAVLGRTLLGWLIGNGSRRRAAAVNFAVQVCGTALLAFGSGVFALGCGCMFFGLASGNLVSLPALIIQKEFAADDAGKAVSLAVAVNQAVFAFAPAMLGLLRDIEGSYALPFAVAAVIQLAAAVIVVANRSATAAAGGGR